MPKNPHLAKALLWSLSEWIIEIYLVDCEDRGLSANTIKWYGWHLRRCRDWLDGQPRQHALGILDAGALAGYVRQTRKTDGQPLARSSKENMLAAMRAFGSWLKAHGADNPAAELPKMKKEKRLPAVLNHGEFGALLAALDGGEVSLRDRALVLLLVDAGPRVSEAAALRREDLDLERGQVTIRGGKGGKDRVAFFSAETARCLREYLATHNRREVFLGESANHPGEPLRARGIRSALARLARRAGLRHLTPHLLRRTCGTELTANGVDEFSVADQFGHEDTSTTRLYARLADERRRVVIQRASPVARLREEMTGRE